MITHGHKVYYFDFFQRGYCPDLELLEVNTKLDSKDCELPVCIQALQIACPKLKVENNQNMSLPSASSDIVEN